MSGKHEASTQIETQLRENLIMLARKVPGPGKLQLSRRSALQLLAARPGPCKTKNPYDAQKNANFSEKKTEKLDQIWAQKLGPETGPLEPWLLSFLRRARSWTCFWSQFPGPKIGPENRRKIEKSANIGFNFGPQRGALKHIFSNPTISLVCGSPDSLTDPSAGS